MKTSVTMKRKMGIFDVFQRTSDGMFNATELLKQWNLNTQNYGDLKKKDMDDYISKAGMPIPYRGGMKALFVLLVCNVSFYCFFRDMSDALAIIRTRPQCREAAP